MVVTSLRRNRVGISGNELELLAHWLLVTAALAGGISFFSGVGAFELMEIELREMRDLVELHSVVGRGAFFLLLLLAVGSAQSIARLARWTPPRWLHRFFTTSPAPGAGDMSAERAPSPVLRRALMVGLTLTCCLLVWTGYLGGSIRHG